ncbi:MAG: LCP family protein [Candidatus Saccharibacteria bacterium]|nr:LCP family protein [Candidatus Saccharibacteria bacterium]
MEKNKSIDGLAFRRDKKVVKKASIDGIAAPKKTIKQTSGRTVPIKPAASKTASKSAKPKTTKPVRTVKVSTPKPVVEPEPIREEIFESDNEPTELVDERVLEKERRAAEKSRKAEEKADKKLAKKAAKKQKASVDDFLAPVEMFNFDSDKNSLVESEDETFKKGSDEDEDDMDEKVDKKALKKARKAEKKAAKKEKKEGKKKSKLKTIIITVVLSIIVLILGAGCALCIWGNDIIMKITGGRGNIFDAIGTMMSDKYDPLDTDENGRTNILAFGTSGYNMEGDEGDGTHDGAQLTDSIMAISIDQKTGDIAMISLPRDLKVTDRCTGTGKINEIYWCHNLNNDNEEAGANALIDNVSNILGIDFQYYAHVNWGSLIQIVNSIGGITITLDETIEYDYNDADDVNHYAIIYAGEPTTLDGYQALGVARARHQTKMGDFSRGNSQQKILIGIKDQIYSQNLGFDTLLSLFGALGDNLRTNFSMSNIKTAIKLTYDFDLNETRQIPLVDYDTGVYYFSTTMINNISYVVPAAGVGNYSAIRARVREQLSSNPITREAANVMILNGTDTPGLAGKAQEALEEEGYNIVSIDNAPDGDYSGVMIYSLSERTTSTVQALKKYYGVQKEEFDAPAGVNTDGIDIIVILGKGTEEDY